MALFSDEAIGKLPLVDRAKLKKLPPFLSIGQIVILATVDNPENLSDKVLRLYKDELTKTLVDSCRSGELPYKGHIDGWSWDSRTQSNPYPETDNGVNDGVMRISQSAQESMMTWKTCPTDRPGSPACLYSSDHLPKEKRLPTDCVLHRDDFRQYREKNKGQWTDSGLLDAWWADSGQIAIKKDEPKIKPRNKQRDNDALILLHAALDEMELKTYKTPSPQELATYVLGDDFQHSNIQARLNAEEGSLINNRVLLLADGTKLDRDGIIRRYQEMRC